MAAENGCVQWGLLVKWWGVVCISLPLVWGHLQVEGFSVYQTYGGNHENAQKLVFELEKDPVIKGFFTVSSFQLP